jgi:hypothetical protein
MMPFFMRVAGHLIHHFLQGILSFLQQVSLSSCWVSCITVEFVCICFYLYLHGIFRVNRSSLIAGFSVTFCGYVYSFNVCSCLLCDIERALV